MESTQEYITTQEQLEESLYEDCVSIGKRIYKELLEEIDQWLFENRDKHIYKLVTSKTTKSKTIFGIISVKKRYYTVELPCAEPYHVYLLDEVMDGERIGSFTLGSRKKNSRTARAKIFLQGHSK